MAKDKYIKKCLSNRCVVILSLKDDLKQKIKEKFDDWDEVSQEEMVEGYNNISDFLDHYKSFYLFDRVPYPSNRFGGEMYDRRQKLLEAVKINVEGIFKNEIADLFIFEEPFNPVLNQFDFKSWDSFCNNFSIDFNDLRWDFSKIKCEQTKI